MPQSIQINLTSEQQAYLGSLTKKGSSSARTIYRARVLLLAANGRRSKDIAELLGISQVTVGSIKRRFVDDGLDRALKDDPRSGKPSKVSKKAEAHLLALACSQAPEGRERWTLQLLANKLVELRLIESISHEAVRTILKKAR